MIVSIKTATGYGLNELTVVKESDTRYVVLINGGEAGEIVLSEDSDLYEEIERFIDLVNS